MHFPRPDYRDNFAAGSGRNWLLSRSEERWSLAQPRRPRTTTQIALFWNATSRQLLHDFTYRQISPVQSSPLHCLSIGMVGRAADSSIFKDINVVCLQ